jgi:hypothetical protein
MARFRFCMVQIVNIKRQERLLLFPLAFGWDDRAAGQCVQSSQLVGQFHYGLAIWAWPGKALHTSTLQGRRISELNTKTWHFCKTGFLQTWDFGHETSLLCPKLLGRTPCPVFSLMGTCPTLQPMQSFWPEVLSREKRVECTLERFRSCLLDVKATSIFLAHP